MSKAFTRESDDAPDRPLPARPSTLPPGAKNYLTSDGAQRLGAELERLVQVERPRLAALTEDAAARQQLQILDRRIQQIEQSLRSAVVVPPPVVRDQRVRFGATVTVREPDGGESFYRIVGVDETDLDRGWVSWLSPIAKALLNAEPGQRVRLKLPAGDVELEVTGVSHD
ncbi:MAG: transcription elongation factor GreB [Pedosphaera sp.]|nr:transcription elongation factor GreB [Pedosphaera sp.]